MLGDHVIGDSKRMMLLRGAGHLPVYAFPREDVVLDHLMPADSATGRPGRWTVRSGERAADAAAWDTASAGLEGHIAFDWAKMDAWYEEEEEVFVHPRDPYHRVDVLASSRHVRIKLAGEVVAESGRPHLLFETGLPTRYYLPREHVRMDLLEPTDTTSRCPYKGIASYWTARVAGGVHPDIAWSYSAPVPECPKVKGLIAFFNERADIHLDGELQPRPETPWSK